MHCLPTHRGQEVAAEVIDGPASVVWQQAANRLPTEQAALYALVTGDWEV
jgi:ornithine carbamoyltransferase